MQQRWYGVTREQEVQVQAQVRDIRTGFERLLAALRAPEAPFLLLLGCTACAFLVPTLLPLLVPLAGLAFGLVAASRERVPLKLPIQSGLPDENEPDPETGRPQRAKGIFFLGNEAGSGKELWLTNSDCRQHFLVLGTTGAGKTEALIGFGANALSWSSGFLFCDGKGDVALMAKIHAMLRRFGREDDLLVLNFMNDASSVRPGRPNTNSINPFATGTADELTQMLVSLMEEVGGDGAMWKGRAVAMLTGVIRALVEKRDRGLLDLNVGEIRRHLSLKEIETLAKDESLSVPTRSAIQAYLKSLPGYQEQPRDRMGNPTDQQSQTTLDQHGYLQMQFTKILGSLTDVYGHIFSTPYGEVDIEDVVLNRRVLVIMLPALKKSGDEINNLGKIVVANLKGMMGNVLGSTIDGAYRDIVDKRATNAPSPFIVVLDEVGYYTVDGMAVMAAQARSLGFSLVFASQDIPAMKRRNEKEAASIVANTNIKIVMRLEDPSETARLAIDRGDKALRVRASGFERRVGDLSGATWLDSGNASLEEASRVSLRDLVSQREGDMHVLFQDRIVRAKAFYANPEGAIDVGALHPRPNHFVRIPRPSAAALRETAGAADAAAPHSAEEAAFLALWKTGEGARRAAADIGERQRSATMAAEPALAGLAAVFAEHAGTLPGWTLPPLHLGRLVAARSGLAERSDQAPRPPVETAEDDDTLPSAGGALPLADREAIEALAGGAPGEETPAARGDAPHRAAGTAARDPEPAARRRSARLAALRALAEARSDEV